MSFVSVSAPTQAPSPATGFSPVANGAAHSQPGGLFGALLEAVSELLAKMENSASAVPTGPGQIATTATLPATSLDDTATTNASGAPKDTLLGSLGKALAAIQKALAEGRKPDRDALDQLDAALDALAGILAQAPQLTAAGDPSPTGAGSGTGASGGYTLDAATALALLKGPDGDLPAGIAGLAHRDGTALTGKTVDVDPKSLLDGLSGKFASLAETLGQTAPELSQKLAALGKAIGSADPDPTTLAALGFARDTRSPAQLVSTAIADSAGGAAPTGFAPATLSLPPGSALNGKPTGPAPGTAAAGPALSVDSNGKAARAVSAATGGDKNSAPDQDAPQPDPAPTDPADGPPSPGQPMPVPVPGPPAASPGAFQPAAAAYQPPPGMIDFVPFALAFAHQAALGASSFSIRLDPPDLGRVDVKLHVDGAGNLNAHMTVERSDTLNLMQSDRGQLERALAQVGLDSGKTNLQFSLNQNPSSGQGGSGGGSGRSAPFRASPEPAATAELAGAGPSPSIRMLRGALVSGGLNLFV